MAHPMRHRKGTWLSNGQRWLKRLGHSMGHDVLGCVDGKKMVKKEVWDRQADQSGSLAWKRYKTARFEATREYIKMAVKHPGISKGVVWLMRARIGAIWTASRAAQAKLVGCEWVGRCPSCGEASVSDLAHLLLCPSYQVERRVHLGPLIRHIRRSNRPSVLSQDDLFIICLGGDIGGKALGTLWSGVCSQVFGGTGVPGFALVARFLQKVMPRAMINLWQHSITTRAQPADRGIAGPSGSHLISTMSQCPQNG